MIRLPLRMSRMQCIALTILPEEPFRSKKIARTFFGCLTLREVALKATWKDFDKAASHDSSVNICKRLSTLIHRFQFKMHFMLQRNSRIYFEPILSKLQQKITLFEVSEMKRRISKYYLVGSLLLYFFIWSSMKFVRFS